MRLSIHKAEKKSEYIYSRSREVRKENPSSTIDIPTLSNSVLYSGRKKFLHFREHGFSNSAKKLVFRTFFSNANNSQFVNMLCFCATLRAFYFNISHRFFTLSVPSVTFCAAKLHKKMTYARENVIFMDFGWRIKGFGEA